MHIACLLFNTQPHRQIQQELSDQDWQELWNIGQGKKILWQREEAHDMVNFMTEIVETNYLSLIVNRPLISTYTNNAHRNYNYNNNNNNHNNTNHTKSGQQKLTLETLNQFNNNNSDNKFNLAIDTKTDPNCRDRPVLTPQDSLYSLTSVLFAALGIQSDIETDRLYDDNKKYKGRYNNEKYDRYKKLLQGLGISETTDESDNESKNGENNEAKTSDEMEPDESHDYYDYSSNNGDNINGSNFNNNNINHMLPALMASRETANKRNKAAHKSHRHLISRKMLPKLLKQTYTKSKHIKLNKLKIQRENRRSSINRNNYKYNNNNNSNDSDGKLQTLNEDNNRLKNRNSVTFNIKNNDSDNNNDKKKKKKTASILSPLSPVLKKVVLHRNKEKEEYENMIAAAHDEYYKDYDGYDIDDDMMDDMDDMDDDMSFLDNGYDKWSNPQEYSSAADYGDDDNDELDINFGDENEFAWLKPDPDAMRGSILLPTQSTDDQSTSVTSDNKESEIMTAG